MEKLREIIVLSEQECFTRAKNDKISNEPYIIISIRDKDKTSIESLRHRPNCSDVLHLKFNDTVDSTSITEEQAKTIVAFLMRNKDITILVIHCFQGVSRSGAIAKVLQSRYPKIKISASSMLNPNPKVMSTVAKIMK